MVDDDVDSLFREIVDDVSTSDVISPEVSK
ncbi:hypothetical protein DP46_4971 [Burkholderia pseudomallei]|nr:hypothetical protein DP46_4971 [Burkholderia pseudomallei]